MNPSPPFGEGTLSSSSSRTVSNRLPCTAARLASSAVPAIAELRKVFTESLILAQDERWRRA